MIRRDAKDGWMECMRWLGVCMHGMTGWVGGLIDGWVGGWMDGWVG